MFLRTSAQAFLLRSASSRARSLASYRVEAAGIEPANVPTVGRAMAVARPARDNPWMAPLPTGTVTFMFTDIEGSTHLLQDLGDGYADLLEGQEAVVRRALAAHDGAEVDTQGDAFFAAFASARDAVAAAEEMQRDLARTAIRVRIGLHTGEAERRGERYVGIDVHRAARICSAAHGGQVLMSQPTRDLGGAETRDLGEHRLKDLLAPQRLFQLVAPGLPDAFPPPRTLERSRTNLPVQATLLVGRAPRARGGAGAPRAEGKPPVYADRPGRSGQDAAGVTARSRAAGLVRRRRLLRRPFGAAGRRPSAAGDRAGYRVGRDAERAGR